ncbi:MAG: hypothetical protein CM15mP4_3310 [Candidatus Neomarinimicrobiota bacterium]|nr:MAG: hypothetical protein CM15mP4_3310 [Candidatus Neomarinimicrobiota bacterium]
MTSTRGFINQMPRIHYVLVGKIFTVVLMILAAFTANENAKYL